MTEVDEFFRSSHHDLIYEIEANGFVQAGQDSWVGEIATLSKTWHVRVDFSAPYPAYPPQVFIEDEKPLSWHQNADGSLCLYSQTSPGAFPWFAHGALRSQIRSWLEKDAAGWVGDFPDLDIERYWTPSERFKLLIHDELPNDGSYWIRFDRTPSSTLVQSGSSRPPRKRPKSHRHLYALSVDIGEVAKPPRSWVELSADLQDSAEVERVLHERRADVLLLRYIRDSRKGVLCLVPIPRGSNQELQFRSVSCASRSPQTMALRTGFQSSDLQGKVVTVVGIGAVGSFISEGLSRSGISRLFLVDGERLRPGNLVRHAAGASSVGKLKAEAMADTLGPSASALVGSVNSLAYAIQLVECSDLVIDATANEVVTQLLAEAGRVSGKAIISVYLANQGRSKVVEVLPCATRERIVPREMVPAGSDGVESGCGDPVSTTPPFAVMEVAAMACRIATAILVDDAENANSELREQR